MPPVTGGVYGECLDVAAREIRLLQTHPSEGSNSITCSLMKASLGVGDSGPPRFNALSYVWGDPNTKLPVRIDGQDTPVTTNLEHALRHLHKHCPPEAEDLPLWVDALCINQQDEQERNQQVAMMGDIYRSAERVLIWLGDGDRNSDWALQRFRCPEFRQEIEQTRRSASAGLSADAVRARVTVNLNIDQRCWWTRVWIIQEVLLAKKDPILICGAHSVPWMDYCYYQDNLPGFQADPIKGTSRREYWETAWKDIPQHSDGIATDRGAAGMYVGGQASIWNGLRRAVQMAGCLHFPFIILARFFRNHATETKDYVYAFRGLLPPEEQGKIQVDYAQPPMKVFHDAMVVFWTSALRDAPAHIIKHLSFHRQGVTGVPSWVPELSAQKAGDLEGYDGSFLQAAIRRQWRGPINAHISENKMVLEFRGIFFDTVREHHEVRFGDPPETAPNFDDIRAAEAVALSALERDIPPSSHLHQWNDVKHLGESTLKIIETFTPLQAGESPEERETTYELWRILLDRPREVGENSILATDREAGNESNLARLREGLSERLRHRRIFTTDAGFIGVGPRHLAAGDIVVFAFGMTSPWLVRPHADTDVTPYAVSMVGCSFVRDLFDFDRLEWALKEGALREIVISIR